MKKIEIGEKIADLKFESTDSTLHSFKDLLGKNVVLYFYPKDNTPGCTLEGKDFGALYPQFVQWNTQILGVSKDNLSCHHKFAQKLALPFPLISDGEQQLCGYFNVIVEKKMFLHIFMGIERSTFLIDQQGILRKVWRKVKVKNHAQQVLAAVEEIMKKSG